MPDISPTHCFDFEGKKPHNEEASPQNSPQEAPPQASPHDNPPPPFLDLESLMRKIWAS